MTKKERTISIIEKLKLEYPDARCELNHSHPYELLIAVRMSAQCTDKRVNIITEKLFKKYKSLEDFAVADISELEEDIHSSGFFRVKARNIIDMSKMLILEYNSIVPDTVEELIKLPGVGRKTANVIIGDIYKKPSIVCDTHCMRITNLLGLTTNRNPDICERELGKILPPEESTDFCHRMVLHGRAICIARRPKCEICPLAEDCKYYIKINKSKA